MLVPTDHFDWLQVPLRDMEKTSIIMRLLMDFLRVEESKKIRVIFDYDPETGMIHAERKEITAAEPLSQ